MEYNADQQVTPIMTADDALSADYEEVTPEINDDSLLVSTLVGEVQSRYQQAKDNRNDAEARWLEAYQNFRGIYGKNIRFRESEKSRVFVKVTKAKVVAAFGQICDVLFGGSGFPLQVKETEVPAGVAKYASPKNDASAAMEGENEDNRGNIAPQGLGYAGDGRQLKPGATMADIMAGNGFLGDLDLPEDKLEDTSNKALKDPAAPTIKPAEMAAKFMDALIKDQIEASDGGNVVRDAIFEACLLGTGVVKGPFTTNKEIPYWAEGAEGEREYQPIFEKTPHIEYVSVWDFFPDPNANRMEDVEWTIQRHKLNRSQLRALKNRPLFDADGIDRAITVGAAYTQEDYENSLKGENDSNNSVQDRYEVLEYWGVADKDLVEKAGLEVDMTEDEVQVNVWVCNGFLLRVATNPFKPYRIPYNVFYYEKNPYSIFGIGVAENMNDSQMIMNGHARMAIDNLALSGSLVFDIDESALAPGQSMDIYPGKKFIRQAGMPGQAIYGIKFPNTSTENMQMFDKFRQLADETTGMPSYSHGQTGVQSTTRTAAGMSMLMGAASLNIKTVVRGIDEDLLAPLGKAYFHWNMQFYDGDLPIRGDLDVVAQGTTSLMNKETKNQKLQQLLQTVANPAIAPLVKLPNIIKELAKTLDLDPDDYINSPEEAKLYAHIMGLQQPQAQAPQQAQQGAVKMPGEEGFQGMPQPTGPQPQPEGQ